MNMRLDKEAALRTYYEKREPRHLSITEFGHNIYPICLTASALDMPYKSYTGVETWYRGGDIAKNKLLSKLNAASKNNLLTPSTRFITHNSGITVHRDENGRWQEGSYTPYIPEEPGCEDEIVASNLFGDPDIAESTSLTRAIFAQMAEMVHPNGRIVLRETITPERIRPFSKTLLGEVGLKGYATYRTINSPLWKKLESIYDGGKAQPLSAKSLYIFLQKEVSASE